MDELTAERKAIVVRPVSSQTVVVAGPGTGKTHVLAARVQALLDCGAVDDPQDVLVLSFTRAAVSELRRRLGDHAVARFVRPSTIDAYARRQLLALGITPRGDFDQVIRETSALLEDAPEAASFAHVIVDEAQDLVDDRRVLVERLLARAKGFTVLGDPAQGIYGWQASTGSTDAVAEVLGRFPEAARFELTHDHRTRAAGASPLRALRNQVAAGADESLLTTLRQTMRTVPTLEPGALALVLRHADEETAVVCRTNGEVLQLSQRLREADVDHRVQPSAEVAVPSAWPARLLGNWGDDALERDDVFSIESSLTESQREAAWEELSRIAGDEKGTVHLALVRRLAYELAELPGLERAVPRLSTVHRIKGLEFDRVIVTEFAERSQNIDTAEESRVLFVAATRARDETLFARLERPSFAMRHRGGRWTATPWRRETPTAIEVRVGDIDRRVPFVDDGSAAFIQRHLRTSVRPGDKVTVESRSVHGQTELQVMHRGLAIGRLDTTAQEAFGRVGLHGMTLTGLVVDRLSTAVGDPETSEAVQAGAGGLWLVPEISGLARIS